MRRRPFGFVRKKDRVRKPYLAGFNPPRGGPEITKAFATEDEADVWLAEQHVAVAKNVFVNPKGSKTLLRDWWAIWISERHLAPTSRETYQGHGERYILPAFGHREIGSLRRNEIQSWVNRLPLAPTTAKTVLAVLQSCLKAAVVDELVVKSNAVGVKGPPIRRKSLIVPSAEEVDAITEHMCPRYAICVRLAAETGLRQGEILGLHVDALDLLGRRLVVREQAQTVASGVVTGLPPKSDAGYRTVPLAPETVDAIALHLAEFKSTGLVVTSTSGAPVRRNLFGEHWTNAKDRADVRQTLRFHDLRHRYASVLIAAGLDALTVKTLMGHSSIAETFDTYGHLFPDQSERAAKAITAGIHAGSRTKPRTKTGNRAGQTA